MLETVREYGLERLATAGEADDARQRHAEHFLRRSDRLARGPQMLQSVVNLTDIAAEQDNVRLALTWFDDRGDIDALLRLSSMLYGLWFQRGLYREARQWLEQAWRARRTRRPWRVARPWWPQASWRRSKGPYPSRHIRRPGLGAGTGAR